jgi:hypothetical protein
MVSTTVRDRQNPKPDLDEQRVHRLHELGTLSTDSGVLCVLTVTVRDRRTYLDEKRVHRLHELLMLRPAVKPPILG